MMKKREVTHREIWFEDARFRLERADKAHRTELAARDAQIAELMKELDERPTRIVTQNLDQQIVDEAIERRDQAYRSRDRAFQALSELRLLHREGAGDRCRCGQRFQKCGVAQVVDRYPALEGWERRQWERMRAGQDHYLPPGHPGVTDPRWTPSGDSEQYSREFAATT
ncbi:hypothetical protein [Frankia sp. KB5]|uniref:hypothetical protein n=1 Tax=Frankia sp. KB5 TaxID=683318 RepID=UPI000A100716|nr:hypothetical protein [Frankia sp. KB5]ORT47062.1 hypothetical protein KBI5_21845 [Frankia sp. KB5]